MKKQDLYKSPVVFDGEHHTYTLDGKQLQGVTPIIGWLFPNTYKGISKSVLDAAAEYGTMVHQACELADDMGIVNEYTTKYKELLTANGLQPVYSEYLVSDEKAIASCIDKVFADDSLGDIKTTSKVHWMNVQVQLSIYAWLYEMQTGREANKLYVIWLPKPRYGEAAIRELPRIPASICEYVVENYLAGVEPFDAMAAMTQYLISEPAERQRKEGEVPERWQSVIDELMLVKQQLDKLTEREKELKASIMQGMQSSGDDKWATDLIQISRVAATERVSLDTKALQSAEPDIYEKYKRTSKVAESLRYKLL